MRTKRSSTTVALLAPLVLALGSGVARAEEVDEEPPAEHRLALEYLVGRLEAGPENISRVLRQYSAIESSRRWDEFARREIHIALLRALGKIDDPAIERAAETLLGGSGRSQQAARILMMKVLIGDRFPQSRDERVATLVEVTRSRDQRTAVWALRLLGDSRWKESVGALIDILRREEKENATESLTWNVASGELYRLLGKHAQRGETADHIRRQWEERGRKLPEKADFEPVASGERTVSFFGEMISPRSAFVVDVSGSMKQSTSVIDIAAERGRTAAGRGRILAGPKEPKIDIVKRELERSLSSLLPHYEFTVISYESEYRPWRGRGGLRLHKASRRNAESAVGFTRALEAGSGTNIHDSLAAALVIPEVETVYLLSDGVPSVGGDKNAVRRRVDALNYLLGVRVITFGFAAEDTGSFDEEFMQRLARENWGWYRRLNKR